MKKYIYYLLFSVIFFSCGDDKKEEDIQFDISTTNLNFSENGGSQTVNISGNAYWSLSYSGGGWCTVTPSSGNGNKSIKITVNKNNSTNNRNQSISISYGSLQSTSGNITLNISQDGSELSSPTGLNAVKDGSQIYVTWNSVSGASSYKIYRSTSSSGSFTSIGTSTTNYKYDSSPLTGNNYYKVTVIDNSGKESPFSSYVLCNYTSGGEATPNAPIGLTATDVGSVLIPEVRITWSSVSGATSYKVYRSNSSSGIYTQIGHSTAYTQLSDFSPITGNNYYKVKAIDNNGKESPFSSYVLCNYTSSGEATPNAPTGLTATNVGSVLIPEIRITWSSVSGATSYKVYRSNSSSGTYTQIGRSTAYTQLSDFSPITGNNYYKVKAVNSAGESSYSSYTSYNHSPSTSVAPCPVTYGSCTVSGTTITMRWTVPTSSGCGTPTKAYLRVRNPISGVYANLQTLSGTATSASFSYGGWANTEGFVYVGIITENDKGTSGGVPKVYDTKNKKWIN